MAGDDSLIGVDFFLQSESIERACENVVGTGGDITIAHKKYIVLNKGNAAKRKTRNIDRLFLVTKNSKSCEVATSYI